MCLSHEERKYLVAYMAQEIGYPKFLRDTAVKQIDKDTWEAELTDDWNIGGVANGGYSMATAARALSESVSYTHLTLRTICSV